MPIIHISRGTSNPSHHSRSFPSSEKTPMFEQASHLIITDSTFVETTNIVNNTEPVLQYLCTHVASGASYDSKDQYEMPKCHPNTRKQVLSNIHEWIQVAEKETGIIFLHGPAGAGKSCIARTVCEKAAEEGLLGASFFFWRDSSSRNNERRFITTLAYQLVEANAELKQHILAEVAKNPRIVDMPLEVQFRKLILEPCRKVSHENLSIRAIVIDGLDECMGEVIQIGILRMLSKAVRYEGLPIGFFVTSRPELHIQEALDTKEIIFSTNVISLNKLPGISQDIQTVLESGFMGILNNPRFKRALKNVARPWPTAESIEKLVHDSSSQFIYASTVLKFVSDPDCNPVSQLELVLHVQNRVDPTSTEVTPLENLYRLYDQIMSGVKHVKLTTKVLCYVIAMKDLTINNRLSKFSEEIRQAVLHNQNRMLLVIEQLLGLSDGMAYSTLNQLHSLVSLSVGSESTRRHLEIGFYHKSFQDYITRTSTIFYVDVKEAHGELAGSCLTFMGLPMYQTESQHVGWLYSSFRWSVHSRESRNNVHISGHEAELQRFTSGSTDYLNIPNLNKALQTLGLVGGVWSDFLKNIQKFGSLSLETLSGAMIDVRLSLDSMWHTTALQLFNELYAYPVFRKFLHSYNNNDAHSTKLFLLVYHLTGGFPLNRISEREACTIFSALGLISDESERSSVILRYKNTTQRVDSLMNRWELEKLITITESTETYHCTPKIISDVHTAIISTGVWRNYMRSIITLWRDSDKGNITATGPLLSCLKSEALEFHDNLVLNQELDEHTENVLFGWFSKKLGGPTEDVIEAWEQAFVKARLLFPDNFKDPWDKKY